MKSIKKFERLPDQLIKIQQESEVDFNVGDMFFTSRADDIIRISKIENIARRKKDDSEWTVFYDHTSTYECTEWSQYGTCDFETFVKRVKSGEYVRMTESIQDLTKKALDVIEGRVDMSVYSQTEYDNSINEERAVMGRSSKESLLSIQKSLDDKKQTALVIARAIEWEMSKRRTELERIKNDMYGVVEKFQKQIKKIMRVITTIELYLGIDEEIHQIQDGEPAHKDVPICFRQMVLYIDEEVGVHENGGLDFKNIKEFDEWIVRDNNIDIVLPEKKGIVVFNPRRYRKNYGDPYLNVHFNISNLYDTYILIRNGDKIFRIYTDKLVIRNRLFPGHKELQTMMKELETAYFDSDKEKIEDLTYGYKKNATLLQGLLDRTEVFHPLKYDRINLFKLDDIQDCVHFIYDDSDDMKLPSGRLSFYDWKTKLNESISNGSRVLITGNEDLRDTTRFYYYSDRDNYPPRPDNAVYDVLLHKGYHRKAWLDKGKEYEDAKKAGRIVKDIGMSRGGQHIVVLYEEYDKEHLTILYNPGDEVMSTGWTYDPHERKQRVRFRIFRDDSFVLNYDLLDLNDIEFYLTSRVDRKNYLDMMPVLKNIKKFRLKELQVEKDFMRLIADRNNHIDDVLTKVEESVRWWKFKNQIKRPITSDDTKALRMIEKRIASKQYESFEKY